MLIQGGGFMKHALALILSLFLISCSDSSGGGGGGTDSPGVEALSPELTNATNNAIIFEKMTNEKLYDWGI